MTFDPQLTSLAAWKRLRDSLNHASRDDHEQANSDRLKFADYCVTY